MKQYLFWLIAFFTSNVFADDFKSELDWHRDNPIIINKGVDAKIVGGKEKKYQYKIDKPDPEEGMIYSDCDNNICECTENISYAKLVGKSEGIEAINRFEKKRADSLKCSDRSDNISNNIIYVFSSPKIVSFVVSEMDFSRGAGGGCHGNFKFATFDTKTGKKIELNEVISTYSGLSEALADNFVKQYSEKHLIDEKDVKIRDKSMQEDNVSVKKYFSDMAKHQYDFVFNDGKLYVNLDDFFYSCAEGNLFPIKIPEKFVKPEFLQKIK